MPPHILIVDDEPDLELLIRQKFRHQIRDGKYRFSFAGNGVEALEMLKQENDYDMILTDLNMPEMDGLTLLSNIKFLDGQYKAVVVSAYGDLDNIRNAMNLGAFDFITKPINFSDLEKTIEKTLVEVEVIRKGMQAREQLQKAIHDKEIAEIERQKAEEAKKHERQFLANMSHEIRTPMNAIIGMTKLLMNISTEYRQLKYIKGIKDSAENLLAIINDILDLSKIESGKIKIEHIPFSINDTLELVITTLKHKADEKGLTLSSKIDPSVPSGIKGDPVRLYQVLMNLVGNAIKFTERGHVNINVITAGHSDGQIPIRFDVSDTGIGISEENLSKIFEKFTQASSDTTRKFGGTGLGLTISKQLIEIQKGLITVWSRPGEGSVFSFTIPYLETVETPVEKGTDIPSPNTLNLIKDKRVLIVEDNAFNQIVAVDSIHEIIPDMPLDLAENGRIAVEMHQKNNYDLIIMDIQMPEMDGFQASQKIRKELPSPLSAVPIIAMTASVTREEVEDCFEAGMDEFVAKPFNQAELISKMSRLLLNENPKQNKYEHH
ncbi:MAG: response regulator [Bacteroidia bacterium]|nr:response regulator [Bacteroidia bacterium]